MTVALCPDCGSLKNGVLLPCKDCGFQPTGDNGIGMSFSSHYLSEKTLEGFSDLFKKLRREAPDEDIAAWTFFYVINEYYLEITYLKIPKEFQQSSKALLERIELKNIIVEDSPTAFASDSVEGKYATKVKHYTKNCPSCDALKSIAAWQVINGSMDPGYIPLIQTLETFHSKCLECQHREELNYEAVYYEFDDRQFAIALRGPDVEPEYRLGEIPNGYFEELSNDFSYRCVTDKLDFVEKIRIFRDGLDDVRVEHAKLTFSIQHGYDITGDLYYDKLDSGFFKDTEFVFRDPTNDFKPVSLSLKGKEDQEKQIVAELQKELSKSNRQWLHINQETIWQTLKQIGSMDHLF